VPQARLRPCKARQLSSSPAGRSGAHCLTTAAQSARARGPLPQPPSIGGSTRTGEGAVRLCCCGAAGAAPNHTVRPATHAQRDVLGREALVEVADDEAGDGDELALQAWGGVWACVEGVEGGTRDGSRGIAHASPWGHGDRVTQPGAPLRGPNPQEGHCCRASYSGAGCGGRAASRTSPLS